MFKQWQFKVTFISHIYENCKMAFFFLENGQHIICRVNQYLTNILCKNMAIYGKVKGHLFKNVRSMDILCVWTMCGYKPLVPSKKKQPASGLWPWRGWWAFKLTRNHFFICQIPEIFGVFRVVCSHTSNYFLTLNIWQLVDGFQKKKSCFSYGTPWLITGNISINLKLRKR
jgi:hypothetical protein